MRIAKVFTNGRSQAVRLPKDCRFAESEVYVKKFDNAVILLSKKDPWAPLIDSLDRFSDDFMEDRNQPAQQDRDEL